MPTLFLIILLSSIVQPNFWWLLAITVIFGWMGLVGVVRAEFLRTRNYDYIRAARAMGVRVVRRGEAVWKYERNDQGDVTRQTDPDGNVTDYTYNKHGQLVGVWYPDNGCHRLVWNERGQLVEEQLPNGGVKRYRYDDVGRQVAREDEHGALTQYQWDAAGRLLKITKPDGATREFSYNPYGKITSERDELGHVTRYEYADGLHLISRRLNADGTQVNYRYDNTRLLLTEIENEVGETYRLDYYPNGLIQQEIGFLASHGISSRNSSSRPHGGLAIAKPEPLRLLGVSSGCTNNSTCNSFGAPEPAKS